jgi:hypothetical protein
MRYSGGTRSIVYGKPITGLEGKCEGRLKEKTDRKEGDIPFGAVKIHMVLGRNRGSTR